MTYSQRDPSYGQYRLGKSKLTIYGYGCFLVSIASLYQKSPLELLKSSGGVTDGGLVDASRIAKYCGGDALPRTTVPPQGWCIAMTNKYAPDFPTHFFCVNAQTKQQIDPLDYPAQIEPLSYPIVEYRPFTNVRLQQESTWEGKAQKWAVENGIIGTGWENPSAPMTQVRVAAALQNLHRLLTTGKASE